MTYFVTGATGFIGTHLVPRLLARRGKIYILLRKGSEAKLERLRETVGSAGDRIVPVYGDLGKKNLGITKKQLGELKGKVKHFFHVAAIYDMKAGAEEQLIANVEGTQNAVDAAEAMAAGRFHHVSSIAVAGLYNGMFREDMFDEAENLDHPYFRTKHDSEGIVRDNCSIPWRIYRPSMVLGDSKSGQIDKIDGPYYFFKLIQKMRDALPPWMPMVGIEGGRLNMVPVDFVVSAMDHIAHKRGLDGKCFHLTDPHPKRIGEVLNIFAQAAHAPQMTMRIDARMFAFIPSALKQGLSMLPPVRRVTQSILQDLGIPEDVLGFINYPTRFDRRETDSALKGSGIEVPELEDYAWRLWDYWERNLDPALFEDHSLRSRVEGRVVVVTGGSSGIGLAAAQMLGEAGAKTIIVARKEEELKQAKKSIEARGGECHYYIGDLADMEGCDALIDKIIEDHDHIDVLVNNAGRSIRRSIALSFDRFHDFERTMQLNYFGALRLILRALPHMVKQHKGHVINISSIGVLSNAPRFSAYVASKAALDAFSRCAASEFADEGVVFTTINMPLVRTPMIAPTKIYKNVPTISPEEAADMIKEAIINRPPRIATRLGIFTAIVYAITPRSTQLLMNSAFRLFGDSAAAKGKKELADKRASSEQIAFASLMRGIHW